jgi:hypothetical protein
MKRLALIIASLASLISVPVWFWLGLKALFSGEPGVGLLMIFIGVPVGLAHAVVFDFVGEALIAKEKEVTARNPGDKADVSNNLRGTPWERNSGHTLK